MQKPKLAKLLQEERSRKVEFEQMNTRIPVDAKQHVPTAPISLVDAIQEYAETVK
jgi:hypothetical protein